MGCVPKMEYLASILGKYLRIKWYGVSSCPRAEHNGVCLNVEMLVASFYSINDKTGDAVVLLIVSVSPYGLF